MPSRAFLVLPFFSLVLLAQKTDAPRHIFSLSEPLTAASGLAPRAVAGDFLRRVAADDGFAPLDLEGVYVAKEYRTQHNGVTHFVYKQRFAGVDVFNAEWTVNIDRDGRVINAGGRLFHVPQPGAALPAFQSAMQAVRAAAMAVNPAAGERFTPFLAAPEGSSKRVRIHQGAFGEDIEGEAVWFGWNGQVRPAWLFHVLDTDRIHNYAVIVDDATQLVLWKESLTFQQSAPRGIVFEGASPQPNPNPGVRLTAPPPIVNRTVQSFAGDPAASPQGWLSGNQTAGNNVIAGADFRGGFFAAPVVTTASNLDFNFPLELGPGAPNPIAFTDAATVNLFYWANRAHDLFYQLGFDEAAGNYQQENFGKGGAGADPLYAYSLYGAAGSPAASFNNAFYRTRRVADGEQSGIHMYLATSRLTGVFSDGSYDAAVIIHEYTHGVSLRLVRQLGGAEGGAMGEAWSDFFALEFLAPEGAPVDGVYPMGEYLFQLFGVGIRTRPYSTSLEINPLTYAAFGRVINAPEAHADGEIWVEALWEMRANLIRQFGEREGRRRARLLVIDGMKLSPPAPTMVTMRDAILLADRVGFRGDSQEQIWAAFARRGLGALAQGSTSTITLNNLASFEQPSPVGAMRFFADSYVIGETVRIVLQDANFSQPAARIQLAGSSGDVETLLLARGAGGFLYAGSIAAAFGPVTLGNGRLELIPGDAIRAYYSDADAGGVGQLIQIAVNAQLPYLAISTQPPQFQFSGETPLDLRPPATTRRVILPFEFPYFGKNYTSVYVHRDGQLTFEQPNPNVIFCPGAGALPFHNGVAPLWLGLNTSGAVQPGENVYQSRTDSSITFRWAGETFLFRAGASREPVNFAATLYNDGRIEFRYGPGNRSLLSNLVDAGPCTDPTPTVGLSNGRESFFQTVASHHARPNLENAPMVVIEPPFFFSSVPVGRLETPALGDSFRGFLSGRGVVFDSGAAISRVDILVDGVAVAAAARGVARPDFCAGENVPGCPNVGFVFSLNFEALGIGPGTHTLRAKVTNARGASWDFPDEPVAFQVESGPPRPPFGRIDTPPNGAEVTGTVPVRGWALAEDLRVTAVDILVDGVTHGRAAYNQVRNDVCTEFPGRPNCPGPGFTFNLNTATGVLLPNGTHTLAARALDETGRFTILDPPVAIMVNNPANLLPVGTLETPANNERLRGIVRVSGYAYDPDGVVRTVSLVVDNVLFAAVPYGQPRPETCEQLSGVAACPNIGFAVDLDTRLLTNGPHTLGIQLTDDRAGTVIIPPLNRRGINILVDN